MRWTTCAKWGSFPLPIYAGATASVLMTILMTYVMRGGSRGTLLLPVRAGGIIFANVAPVIALRSRVDESTSYPDIQGIGCFAEQHTFSRWVYAVASANMLV